MADKQLLNIENSHNDLYYAAHKTMSRREREGELIGKWQLESCIEIQKYIVFGRAWHITWGTGITGPSPTLSPDWEHKLIDADLLRNHTPWGWLA